MDERLIQFRVGVMVLATVIITGVLILLFGEVPSLVQGTYEVQMRFDQAPGVTVDTPVRKSGILVGRVTNVELIDDRFGGVMVTALVSDQRRLYRDEVPRVTQGLLGDATIEVVPGDTMPGVRQVVAQDTVWAGRVADNPIKAVTEIQAELQLLLQDVRAKLNTLDTNVESTTLEVRDAVVSFRHTTEAWTELANQWTDIGRSVKVFLEGEPVVDQPPQRPFRDASFKHPGQPLPPGVEPPPLPLNPAQPRNQPPRRQGAMQQAQETLQAVESAVTELETFLRDIRLVVTDSELRRNIDATAAQLPEAVRQSRETLASAEKTLDNINESVDSIEQQVGVVLTDARAAVADVRMSVDTVQKDTSAAIGRIDLSFRASIDEIRKGILAGVMALENDTRALVQGLDEDLETTLATGRATLAEMQTTLRTVNAAAGSARTNFDNLVPLTEALGRNSGALIAELEAAAANLRQGIARINELVQTAAEGEGTLGLLLRDPTLYNNANTLVFNVNEIVRRLPLILNDIRVITDKVARDPGRVLGGLIREETVIK
jgi:ABC-type transporter Mla subunit MlaD